MDTKDKRRKRMALSEVFVALLLDSFDRHLTLKDVVSSFYKDPRFPLVPSLDEIRQVIYDLLQQPDHVGPGTGGWELVGSDGMRLQVDGPKQFAINSIQQQLRRASVADKRRATGDEHVASDTRSGTRTAAGEDTGTVTVVGTGGGAVAAGEAPKPESYSWYRAEIVNRSITDEEKREALRAHLVWLADKLDEDSLDHQLITIKYELMAATDASLAADFKMRTQAIQANKVDIEEEL
jgi:uncharacterized protein with von Willebrand factor type A (vWA) domain